MDLEQRVVYLHLVSIRDAAVLSKVCSSFLARSNNGGLCENGEGDAAGKSHNAATGDSFHSFMADAEFEAARALLFLFSVSHLIICNNPGSRFDLSLVRLFRNLDTIRQKLQPSITEALRPVAGISKEWMYAGRPCSPRLLFVFEKNPLANGGGGSGGGAATSANIDPGLPSGPPSIYGNVNNNNRLLGGVGGIQANLPPDPDDLENLQRRGVVSTDAIKRLQHNMEDQIYRILRKARVITNISNNSLFAVPANEEFVYVMRNKSEGDFFENQITGGQNNTNNADGDTLEDPMAFLSRKLAALCVLGGDSSSSSASVASKSSASLASGGSSASNNNPNWTTTSTANSASSSSIANQSKSSSSATSNRPTSFKAFIQRHIDQALNKGRSPIVVFDGWMNW